MLGGGYKREQLVYLERIVEERNLVPGYGEYINKYKLTVDAKIYQYLPKKEKSHLVKDIKL